MILVIVESAKKARLFGELLGGAYRVEASNGHLRDLPENAAQVPEQYRHLPWASLGVNPDDFTPLYVTGDAAHVQRLRTLSERALRTVLATDGDREGEAIAWHLCALLEIPPEFARRAVFTEITKEAITAALQNTRGLDLHLVAAQEARRILDRLVGYKFSGKVADALKKNPHGEGLSAGRVQSAMLALVVQRELSRMRFASAGFGSVYAELAGGIKARMTALHGERLATASAFGPDGNPKPGFRVQDAAEARRLAAALPGRLEILNVERGESRAAPPPPLTTSALQKAALKLKISPETCMELAQSLYEAGHISYHRTDAAILGDEATAVARALLDAAGLPKTPEPRRYRAGKDAQAAHEAIRPAGGAWKAPADSGLSGGELAVYTLIFERTLATQMPDALTRITRTTLGAAGAEFRAEHKAVQDPGWRCLLAGEEEEAAAGAALAGDPGAFLPATYTVKAEKTSPPPRYHGGSMGDTLDRLNLTRPSTRVAAIKTLKERDYVRMDGEWVPTATGVLKTVFLDRLAPALVDPRYTATMEAELDRVASGERDWRDYLGEAWSAHLAPALRQDTPPPTLALAGGYTLAASRDGPVLQHGARRVPVPDMAFPFSDWGDKELESIMQGKKPRKKASKKQYKDE